VADARNTRLAGRHIQNRFGVPGRRAGRTGPVDWDDKIDEFGFESVESLEIRVQRSWTPDEIVGYLLSLSYCSPKASGDQQAEFEAAVRDSLAERDESRFVQNDVETVISGVNPGRERR
jgi:hypothetical protein